MSNASELLSILQAASYPVTAIPGRLFCQLHVHQHFSTVQNSSRIELYWRQRNITFKTSRCKERCHTNSGSMCPRANECISSTNASAQAYGRFPPHRSLNCSTVNLLRLQCTTANDVVDLQPVLMAVAHAHNRAPGKYMSQHAMLVVSLKVCLPAKRQCNWMFSQKALKHVFSKSSQQATYDMPCHCQLPICWQFVQTPRRHMPFHKLSSATDMSTTSLRCCVLQVPEPGGPTQGCLKIPTPRMLSEQTGWMTLRS